MKKNKYIRLLMLAPLLALAAGCSDYDDWNTVQEDSNPAAEQTLWENITSQSQISDFVKVLKKAGLQETLCANRYYTVWAPLDGTFNVDSVMNCTDNAILQQFINNHIAEYNHLAKGNLYERVKTLNKKSYEFMLSDGNYTYNAQPLVANMYNLPSSNGTLHVINGESEFLPNGLEALSMIEGIDTVATYIMQYNDTTLDTRSSVIGPVVNGKQTYLDSVFTTSNTLTTRLRARIESEDSTYSILLPTNEAYIKQYNTIKPFFKFYDGMKCEVYNETTNSFESQTITASTLGVNFAFLSDSLTRRTIVDNLFYSNNNPYNMHLVKADAVNYNDTIVSTRRDKFSNGDEIFNEQYIVNKERLSNGFGYVVDTLAFKPWETYNPPIVTPGFFAERHVNELTFSRVSVPQDYVNTDLVTLKPGQTLSFCWATSGERSKPEVDYTIDGVMATTYNIYAVIPPANVDLRDTVNAVKPNILNFSYNGYYVDENGKTQYTNSDLVFKNERYDGESIVQGGTAKLQDTDFVNDTSKVDTMFLGRLTIPYCYAGTGYAPNIKVTSSARINVLRKAILENYSRDIRICSIIFRPLDYEAYLEEEGNVKSRKSTKK
jgi:uncharacterized surface protein with fasciclin (FAS1) repeats